MKLLRDKNGRFTTKNNTSKQLKSTTHVALVIDDSGSMHHLKDSVIKFINETIDTIRVNSRKYKQDTKLTLSQFNTQHRVLYTNQDINKVKLFRDYHPGGGTALFNAVCETIKDFKSRDNGKDSFLLYVCTDGEENSSTSENKIAIRKLIHDNQLTNRWTFVFHLPKGYANIFSSQFNISKDNIREWDATEEGLNQAKISTQSGFDQYYISRSLGLTSTNTFFADLSKIQPTQVKQTLDDLSRQYSIYTVDKECDIRSFVENKTGRPYVAGTTFYELTKPEKLQSYKEILVMPRGQKKLYGGDQARQLIKLPDEDVKLDIKNLSSWRLFLQSTSYTRKLVRGTLIAVANVW